MRDRSSCNIKRRRVVISFLAAVAVAWFGASVRAGDAVVLPRSTEWVHNSRWANPELCGRTFWVTLHAGSTVGGSATALARLGHDNRYALYSMPTLERNLKSTGHPSSAALAAFFGRAERGELPIIGHTFFTYAGNARIANVDGEPCAVHARRSISDYPTKEDMAAYRAKYGRGWLGWGPYTEWGNDYSSLAGESMTGAFRGRPEEAACKATVSGALFGHGIKNREDFVAGAEKFWKAFHAPYKTAGGYDVYAHDGSEYWAIQWPALWGARSIITENRVPFGNIAEYQAFTRAAGRMGNIPWGFWPAHDWVTPLSRENRLTDAGANLYFNPSFYRRSAYYMCMGNAAIVADEQGQTRYLNFTPTSIWKGSAPVSIEDEQVRLSWYGRIWEEVMDFADVFPDRGVPYTPVGILLSWRNGFRPVGVKAGYNLFPYDETEHVCRAIFHGSVFPNRERRGSDPDLMSASPFGDIFDPLRIDTPQGALPLELLRNYRVLIALTEPDLKPEAVSRLREYVREGGTLVLNVRNLPPSLDAQFLGAGIAAKVLSTARAVAAADRQELLGPFDYCRLFPEPGAAVLYRAAGGDPLVTRHAVGKGAVILVGVHWLNRQQRLACAKDAEPPAFSPLADELLGRLRDAIFPFRFFGQRVREQLGYQVNRKGDGWVLTLYNNGGRETGFGKGPEVVAPEKVLNVKIAVDRRYVDAVEWIGRSRLRFREQSGRPTLGVTLAPGDVKIVEIQPALIPPLVSTEAVNLARGKTASASSSRDAAHGPASAVNGNCELTDGWQSKDGFPQKLSVDLGAIELLSSVNLKLAWPEQDMVDARAGLKPKIYQYHAEWSPNGEQWSLLFDARTNQSPEHPKGYHRHFEQPIPARFVKVVIDGSSTEKMAHVVELEVYGARTGPQTYAWKDAE